MTDRLDAMRPPSALIEPYSPLRRTALVLAGTGTAGAYHAGVLRALHEAGVKIDIVAGRGIGVVGALFAAVDGAQRLWDEKGFWRAPDVQSLYGWRAVPRAVAWALAASVAIVALPVAAVAVGLVVFPIDFLLKIVGAGGAAGLVGAYLRFADAAFAPDMLPTWLPRLVLLVLGGAAAAAAIDGWRNSPRRGRGAFWWRATQAPMSSRSAIDRCWRVMWDLVRGAAALEQPPPAELGRRYAELLADNLGQPGFRELLIAVHDADAHRDLLFALVGESRRRDLVRRATSEAAEARRAEVFDLAGVARDHLPDAVAAALTVPLATAWHAVTFAPDAYWRGETHRLGDRPWRRADSARVGGARNARTARARGAAARRPRAPGRISDLHGGGDRPRRDDDYGRRADFHRTAGAQSHRAVRFRRRLRRPIAPAPGPWRADESRLRRRLSSVCRADRGRLRGQSRLDFQLSSLKYEV
jgi:hypothetical protein